VEKTFFLEMADKYKDTIYRIALNYYGNPYDADDTVQEVLLKLYAADRGFESEEHVRNWLIRVTINECKNVLRSPWKSRTDAWEEVCASSAFETPEEGELLQAVLRLPEKYRMPLYLFYYEELSVREIAALLKLKESAVTTRLSRARERLKEKLTEGGHNEF